MKKILIAAAAIIAASCVIAVSQTQVPRFQPGFRTIDGSQLNIIADAVNNIQLAGPICPTYRTGDTPAATDVAFFIAPRAMRVRSISEVHAVAAGGASALQVTKDTGTAAPGAGTDLLTSTGFDLNATANTVQNGTLVTTLGVTTLAAGNRLSVDFANAIQSSVGVVVTVCLFAL